MKRLLLLLLVMPVLAAAKTPVEEDILNATLDASSPYYYPNLILRYNAGDVTLTDDDYHYLYYGYAYQEGYKPLATNTDLDRMLLMASAIDIEKPLRESVEKLLSATGDALKQDPFSPQILNVMAFCYGALGDKQNEKIYFDKTKAVLRTIEASGDGLTEKTARHILMFQHALDLIASQGVTAGKSRIISREVEYVPLLTVQRIDDRKIKGYYFDYSRIYRNKPEGYVFKRERTWQFNNLKPREYK